MAYPANGHADRVLCPGMAAYPDLCTSRTAGAYATIRTFHRHITSDESIEMPCPTAARTYLQADIPLY